MAITLEQYQHVQTGTREIQRLALAFADMGESKISNLLLQAAVRASRIKPTQPAASAPAKAEKGKGA